VKSEISSHGLFSNSGLIAPSPSPFFFTRNSHTVAKTPPQTRHSLMCQPSYLVRNITALRPPSPRSAVAMVVVAAALTSALVTLQALNTAGQRWAFPKEKAAAIGVPSPSRHHIPVNDLASPITRASANYLTVPWVHGSQIWLGFFRPVHCLDNHRHRCLSDSAGAGTSLCWHWKSWSTIELAALHRAAVLFTILGASGTVTFNRKRILDLMPPINCLVSLSTMESRPSPLLRHPPIQHIDPFHLLPSRSPNKEAQQQT
jgi:hypothetical protein